jgi:AraC-like DNA-binding protein
MQLTYYLPSPCWRAHVSVHAVVQAVLQPQVAVLPAMLPNLHIRLAGCTHYQFGESPPITAPAFSLIGPTSQAYKMWLSPGVRMVSIGLLPVGWGVIMGLPAHTCANQLIAGEALWPASSLAAWLDELQASPLDGLHLPCVERGLALALKPAALAAPALGWQTDAIDHWLEHSPTLSLDALASQLGVGARQLRRITEHTHGLSPKALAMKYRALRTAHAVTLSQGDMQHPQVTQALLAYADQSHAIRDFQRFIGWTPAPHWRAAMAQACGGRWRCGASDWRQKTFPTPRPAASPNCACWRKPMPMDAPTGRVFSCSNPPKLNNCAPYITACHKLRVASNAALAACAGQRCSAQGWAHRLFICVGSEQAGIRKTWRCLLIWSGGQSSSGQTGGQQEEAQRRSQGCSHSPNHQPGGGERAGGGYLLGRGPRQAQYWVAGR